MGNLILNLNDLVAALPPTPEGDAAELATAVGTVSTSAEADDALNDMINKWAAV